MLSIYNLKNQDIIEKNFEMFIGTVLTKYEGDLQKPNIVNVFILTP